MVQGKSQKAEISDASGAPVVSGPQILQYADATAFIKANDMNRAPDSRATNFWEEGQVYYLRDGRVAEYSQTNCAHSFPLVAVFNSYAERANYRRKLPLHYRRFG